MGTDRVENIKIIAPHLKEEEWRKDRKKILIMDLQDGSISDLRVFYYLLLLKRKAKIFGEFREESIDFKLDTSRIQTDRLDIIGTHILESSEQ